MSNLPAILHDGKPHGIEEIASSMGKTIGEALTYCHLHWWRIQPCASDKGFQYKLRDKIRVMRVQDLGD